MGRFDHCRGTFHLILAVWGTLWGLSPHFDGSGDTFGIMWAPWLPFLAPSGALGALFGVIWDLSGPLWAPLGRPGAERGAKVDLQAGEPEKWTILGSHFGRVLGGQNHPKNMF